MSTMRVEIIAPDSVDRFDNVEFASFFAETGSIGILPNHTDILGTLRTCVVLLHREGTDHKFAVSGGFFEVRHGILTLLTDSSERSDTIDVERALVAKKRAEELLLREKGIDSIRVQAALMRALNRLKAAGRE